MVLAGTRCARVSAERRRARTREAQPRVSPCKTHRSGRSTRPMEVRARASATLQHDGRRLDALFAPSRAARARRNAADDRGRVHHAGAHDSREAITEADRLVKIVQAVGWYYPDSVGGTEVYVSALSRVLRLAGHEVLVAAPEPGLSSPRTYAVDGTDVFRYPIPLAPSRDEAQGDVTVRGAEHFHRWLSSQR